MRLSRTAASALVSSVALFGCTALLGSFEVSDSAGKIEGGGGDGPITTDAASDASDAPPDAPPGLLKCTVSTNNIRTIDVAKPRQFGGNEPLRFDRVKIYRINDTKVRIVSRPTQSDGFVVYDFNPRQGSAPTLLNVALGSRLFAVHKLANAIGLLGTTANNPGLPNPNRLELHRVADADLVDQIIPLTLDNAVNPNSVPNTRGPSADFTLVGTPANPDFFYSYTTEASETGPFDLNVGKTNGGGAPTGPKLIYTSINRMNPARPAALFHAGGRVYMPLEQDSNGPPSTSDSIIDTPADANGPIISTARSVAPPGGKPNLFFGGGPSKNTPGAFNAAYLEVDLTSTTAPITFRLGSVPVTKLPTFTAADVPVAFTFDSVTRLTTDGGDPTWIDDHFLSLGRGTNQPGFNFFWYDAAARAMRVNQTGPDAFFKDHMKIRDAAIAFASMPTMIFTSFDIAWTETTIVDGGETETLFYSEMACIR
jgi:hypothetical protein